MLARAEADLEPDVIDRRTKQPDRIEGAPFGYHHAQARQPLGQGGFTPRLERSTKSAAIEPTPVIAYRRDGSGRINQAGI